LAYYLDTSAAVKLVVDEPESAALLEWLAQHEREVVSSDLLRTELLRATRRGAPDEVPRARAVLEAATLLELPTATFERAAALGPDALRSLDALHLAAALELGDELDGVITYDERLAGAAALHGIAVVAPG
jgi:predicted nucleic acid-binding protein